MIPVPLSDIVPSSWERTMFNCPGDNPVTALTDLNGKIWVWHENKCYNSAGTVVYTATVGSGMDVHDRFYSACAFGEWFYFFRYWYTSGSPCYWYLRLYGYRPRDNRAVLIKSLSASNGLGLIDPGSYMAGTASVDPITKIGLYGMVLYVSATLYHDKTIGGIGTFTAPALGDESDPVMGTVLNNQDEDTIGLHGAVPDMWTVGAHDNQGVVSYWQTSSMTYYYRKITNLASPSLTTLWSGSSPVYPVMRGASFISRDSAPNTLYNFDASKSWALGGTTLTFPGYVQMLGEDATYYYINLWSYSNILRRIRLLKSGTTVYNIETLSASWYLLSDSVEWGTGDHQIAGRVGLRYPPVQFVCRNGAVLKQLVLPIVEAT